MKTFMGEIKEKPIFYSKSKTLREAKEGKAECFDCHTSIKVNEEEVENGSLLVYEDNGREIFAFKCDECLKKSEELSEYKECEVYSRIVGYIRPVKQWNKGKMREYEERKEYDKVLQE